MKTRIVILLSFVLFIWSCKTDSFPQGPVQQEPGFLPLSPDPTLTYGIGNPISIKGEIKDVENIKTFSVFVFNDAINMDTVFKEVRPVNNIEYKYDEIFVPKSTDFGGSLNTYIMELKITYDQTTSALAPTSYFEEIKVAK
jgi:hypothetical protein